MTDPLACYQDFTAAVGGRLEARAEAYAVRSFSLAPAALVAELEQEALDLSGWGYVLWHRLRTLREAAERLTPKREAMTYHGAKGELVVLQDTREQTSPRFPDDVSVQSAKLDFGDYTAAGLSDVVALELKWSLDDLVACVTGERERFETMLAGLVRYPVRALIVAASERDVWAHRYHSRTAPKAVISSTWAWAQTGIPTVWANDRDGATEAIVWWLRRCQAKVTKAKTKANGDTHA